MLWKKIYKTLAPISTVLRVVTPFFIFRFPVLVTFLVVGLDWIDGELYYQWKIKRIIYNYFDKGLDLYWYTFSLYFAYFSLPYFNLLLILYLIRLLGQILFYVTKSDNVFIFFPNFYEFIFTFVLVAKYFKFTGFLSGGSNFIVIVVVLCFLKLVQELYAHYYSIMINDKIPEWMRGPDR
jgi:hypothetical protein